MIQIPDPGGNEGPIYFPVQDWPEAGETLHPGSCFFPWRRRYSGRYSPAHHVVRGSISSEAVSLPF